VALPDATTSGHAAGAREAALAMKVRSDQPQLNTFLVGPQLHALRGEVYVEPDILEGDIETGAYYSELTWKNSAEAETHFAAFGSSSEPVCWMQIGYASGYTSAVMGRPIIFRETECIACGSPHCRIVGRPAEQVDARERAFMPSASFRAVDSKAADGTGAVERGVVGASPSFLSAWHLLNKVAPFSTTVMLLGETGVGKEIFARTIHNVSPRGRRKMLSVNCAAIPENLIDAELFGVEKGAYTGANQTRGGWFEAAKGSTLFLDEIGTLSSTAQAKLLRVLQEGEFSRVGGTVTRHSDARIICATNVELEAEVRSGRFRADLFHRLNAFQISIPPLRDRRDDIPPLVQYFLKRFNKRTGRSVGGFTISALDALLLYDFPGNIRELENMIERAAILTPDGEPIDTFHLFHNQSVLHRAFFTLQPNGALTRKKIVDASSTGGAEATASKKMSLKEMERHAISEALRATKGNVSQAAGILGLTRAQLRHRLSKQVRP
jgi:two-component system, NtrC family, response regulator HydG